MANDGVYVGVRCAWVCVDYPCVVSVIGACCVAMYVYTGCVSCVAADVGVVEVVVCVDDAGFACIDGRCVGFVCNMSGVSVVVDVVLTRMMLMST